VSAVGSFGGFGVIIGIFFDCKDVSFGMGFSGLFGFGGVAECLEWGFGLECFLVEFVLGRSFRGHANK
jgi:hypothetical protein